MTARKYDVRRCSRETLDRFAEWWLALYPEDAPDMQDAPRRLRSEARVRTRTEIDREIGKRLRASPCIVKTRVGAGSVRVDGLNAVIIETEPQPLIDLINASEAAPEEP